jgi:hypothetical protein
MDFFSKLKNCIEEFFLYIDNFFQEYFFCSKHAKPEDFEASIILENDFIKTTNKQEDEIEDTFEILSKSDIN